MRSGSESAGQRRAIAFLSEAKRRLHEAKEAGDHGALIVLERVDQTLARPQPACENLVECRLH